MFWRWKKIFNATFIYVWTRHRRRLDQMIMVAWTTESRACATLWYIFSNIARNLNNHLYIHAFPSFLFYSVERCTFSNSTVPVAWITVDTNWNGKQPITVCWAYGAQQPYTERSKIACSWIKQVVLKVLCKFNFSFQMGNFLIQSVNRDGVT